MKEKILKFFKEDRSYLGAIRLYNEVGNSLSVKKQINLQPENMMKGILFDQLRILAGITQDEFKIILASAVKSVKAEEKKVPDPEPNTEATEKEVKLPAKKSAAKKKKTPPKK